MRFTGFQDCLGKKIYEGDVVKAPSGLLYKVIWDEDFKQFMFDGSMSGSSIMVAIDQHFEIISSSLGRA